MKPTKAGRYVVELNENDVQTMNDGDLTVIEESQIIAPAEPQQSEVNYYVKEMGDVHLKFHVINRRGDAEMGTWSIAQCWSKSNAQEIADLLNKADIRNEFKGGVG